MKQIVVLFLIAASGYAAEFDWSYEYQNEWAGECQTGLNQSPINIITKSALLDTDGTHLRGPLVFRGYNSVQVTAQNDGHTIRWTIVDGSPMPVLSGGPLRGNYSFLELHMHWLSEHAIDGMKYPLEIHMVHIKTGLTPEEAFERPDGVAVIGVFCQTFIGEESEYALAELAPVIPQLVDRGTGSVPASIIDISRLFSPEPQSYFTYYGSLTTPLCQEVVTWIVMDTPIIISDEQYKLIRTVDVGGVDNYRNLQPSNCVVYRSPQSCSNVAIPKSLNFFTTLFGLKSFCSTIASKGICSLVNIKKKYLGNKFEECT